MEELEKIRDNLQDARNLIEAAYLQIVEEIKEDIARLNAMGVVHAELVWDRGAVPRLVCIPQCKMN